MKSRFLLAILCLFVLPQASFPFYGNWFATDSAAQLGYSASEFPGTDSPGSRPCASTYGTLFAPNKSNHDSLLYDYGAQDLVKENNISWSSASITWFNQNYQYNWVHQILQSPYTIYDPDGYASSTIPNIDHYDVDPLWEVVYQGYEESEIGTHYPEFFRANINYSISSWWRTQTATPSSATGTFSSESELTYSTIYDDWQPACQQPVGIINFNTTNEDRWSFEAANKWQGWNAYNISAGSVTGGKLVIDPSGADPYITGPPLYLPASKYKYVLIKMASNLKDGYGNIYFKTSSENSYSETKNVRFTVQYCNLCGNAAYKSYLVYMGSNSKWSGTITGIRIDPGNNGQSGTNRDSVGFDLISVLE